MCGIVTDRPPSRSVRMAATASPPAPVGTGKARYTQSSPSSAKAALCMTGDSECRTGSPMTAATRVSPLSGLGADGQHSPLARHSAAARSNSSLVSVKVWRPLSSVST